MNKTVLFGLKDENGTEYKLILTDPVSVNTQVFAQAIPNENKPEFKAGQWAGFRTNDGKIHPFLIHHFGGIMVYGQDFKCEDDIYKVRLQVYRSNLISVTPAEIKSHLKKICDEKYIGKKVKCLIDNDIREVACFAIYLSSEDKLCYESIDEVIMCVYHKGKFASIIPPDKKKLPKTREEFEKFLSEYTERRLIPFDDLNKDEFLDQYEI